MVAIAQPRTLNPVMPSAVHSLSKNHYSVDTKNSSSTIINIPSISVSGATAKVIRAVSNLTRVTTLTILAVALLVIPGVAGGIAYQVATNHNNPVTIVQTQYVPSDGVNYDVEREQVVQTSSSVRLAG